MAEFRLDLLTSEVISNVDIVELLNNNSTHLTNHIGENYTSWHFEELETALDIMTSLQKSKLAHRFWQGEQLFIANRWRTQ